MDKDKDYYKILGVDEKSSDDEIKKAYRRLSMVHHPDKNGNTDESKQMFQELNNAYATLSDANKRRTYDMMRKGGGGGGGGGFHHFGGGGGGGGGGGSGGFPPRNSRRITSYVVWRRSSARRPRRRRPEIHVSVI